MAAYSRIVFSSQILQKTNTFTYRLSPLLVSRLLSSNTQTISSSKRQQKIIVPSRIKREPTDILEAIASTVGKDYTAPHYKYQDDPYFIPASNIAKRSHALSKESGRKTARYILENHPSFFAPNAAQPHVEMFMAPPKLDIENNASVELLRELISKSKVCESFEAYSALKKKGTEIDDSTLQELLELQCFYNSSEAPNEEYIEEQWFKQNVWKDRRKTWRDKGPADQIFNDIKEQNAAHYSAMILGLSKYLQVDKAYQLYQEMVEKHIPVSTDVYNSLISISCYLRESSDTRWELVEELLKSMSKAGVVPNLGTLNALLESLSRLGNWRNAKKYALSILAEMRLFDLEPCLASYYFMLLIFCRDRGPTSGILYNIIDRIEGKDMEIQDARDIFFFVTAMDVCHTHLQDKDLAYRVHKCLEYGNNDLLIGDSMKESIYYQHFFRLLCGTENIDTFFEFYFKLVPNTYTPEPSVMQDIIHAIALNGTLQYLPQIWSDIVAFDQFYRENVIQSLLYVSAHNKPDDVKLQEQFVAIALDARARIMQQREDKLRSMIQFTGEMLGNVLITCINGGDLDKAWEVMQQCIDEPNDIVGCMQIEAIEVFIKSCIEKNEASKALHSLQYASEAGYTETKELGEQIKLGLLLTAAQKSKVEKLITTYLKDEQTS